MRPAMELTLANLAELAADIPARGGSLPRRRLRATGTTGAPDVAATAAGGHAVASESQRSGAV